MRLQVVSSNSTYYWSVTNAAPAKPYLQISNQYLPLTTATRAGIKLKVQSGNTTYRAAVYESGYYNTTSVAVGNLSSTTALTRASTSATLTRASTSATLTRASTSATLTRASTSATLTRASTSVTYTRSSISGYGTRSSISGYATSASRVNYNITVYTKTTNMISNSYGHGAIGRENYVVGYFTNTEYSDAKVSGYVIADWYHIWNGAYVTTTAGNNYDKSSYSFKGLSSANTMNQYLDTCRNGNSQVPRAQVFFTMSGNTTRTTSSTYPMNYQIQATSRDIWVNGETFSGTSSSRLIPGTTEAPWFETASSRTLNTIATRIGSTIKSQFGNIFSTWTETRTYTWAVSTKSVRISNPFHSNYAMWITMTTTSMAHYIYMELRVSEVVATYSTKAVTTATLTRASTSATYTRASASAYGTRSSISGYGTRSSISGYGTRSSISGYATRSSISGYGTRASTSGYSGKLSSSKWA